MTQEQFFAQWHVDHCTKEGRLIRDLREQGFTWRQIDTVLTQMTDHHTPYAEEWRIARSAHSLAQ